MGDLASPSPTGAAPAPERPDFFANARDRLSRIERWHLSFCRWSMTNGLVNRVICWFQRNGGALWVHLGSKNIRWVRGLDRVPHLPDLDSYIIVSNHRTYFDLFVISMLLFRHGIRRRVLFPVRSNFFYDNPLGFFLNGAMSFWSMYPPLFRDRKRASLNQTALNEMAWALGEAKMAIGIHPEGRRNRNDDPYTLLPAQAGLGRLVAQTGATVLPAFIHGMNNSFWSQIKRNLFRTDDHMLVVFGEPVDFGDMSRFADNSKGHREIAQIALDRIAELGLQERELREALDAGRDPATLGAKRG